MANRYFIAILTFLVLVFTSYSMAQFRCADTESCLAGDEICTAMGSFWSDVKSTQETWPASFFVSFPNENIVEYTSDKKYCKRTKSIDS